MSRGILVTGVPRCGSTWVGRTVAQATPVRYIAEPFNFNNLPCSCGTVFDHWFQYISGENEARYYDHLVHTILHPYSRYNLRNCLITLAKRKHVRPLLDLATALFYPRPLVKDPLAIFSAEWLASAFDMDVIVLIRHPAAVVASYKRLGWLHPLEHFLAQPLLMERYLSSFDDEIRAYLRCAPEPVGSTTLLWKLVHHVILEYQKSQPDWLFIRYEDLAQAPEQGFGGIFDKLSLPLSERIKRMIQEHTHPKSHVDTTNPHSIKRDSQANLMKWKERLTPQEIRQVRTQGADISEAFYTEAEW